MKTDIKPNHLFNNDFSAQEQRIWRAALAWEPRDPVLAQTKETERRFSIGLNSTTAPSGANMSREGFSPSQTEYRSKPISNRRSVAASSCACLALALCLLGFLLPARGGDPFLNSIIQPMDTKVSAGAAMKISAFANTAYPPLTFQWQHEGANVPGATTAILTISSVTVADAGGYIAWITNAIGGFTNTRTAILTVDPTFVRINEGPGGTEASGSIGGAWGDYDGDGYPDLIIANANIGNYAAYNAFWHNNRNATFTKLTTARPVLDAGAWLWPYWVDYDNDGDLDLHVLASDTQPDKFYRNDGNGLFTPTTPEFVKTTTPYYTSYGELCGWFDFNNDGWLDAFIPRNNANDLLFRGGPGGLFQSMTVADVGSVVSAPSYWVAAIFDYDNDGWQDLMVAPLGTAGLKSRLYHNESGFFRQITVGNLANQISSFSDTWTTFAVGDYDNDGDLDLMVAAGEDGYRGRLYRNDGNGSFTNVAAAAGLNRPLNALNATWVDYDNDGNLDLFIMTGTYFNPPQTYGSTNVMFHNNGDGTFTSVDIGSPLLDGVRRCSSVWVDYDHDGFLDFFLACGNGNAERNYLYRNNLPATGNTNRWLNVRLVGKASNSMGVGAKVRATAMIRGKVVQQLRVITVPGSLTQEDYLAHFGLGDATNVTTLRIEWPSGIVQELQNVDANQFLTVVECQGYTNTNAIPKLISAARVAGRTELLFAEPAANARYVLEASTNLVHWTKLMARTSAGGTFNHTDTTATNYTKRFYRLLVP